MKLLWTLITCLILASCSSVLCENRCSESQYGPYDKTSSREATRHIAVPCSMKNDYLRSAMGKRASSSGQCPELYHRFSTDHTYCKESTCNRISEGVTEDDKRLILDIHNSFRNKMASGEESRYRKFPSAANMMELEWDDELARVAQAHANLCIYDHDGNEARSVENFDVGQNLMGSDTEIKNWSKSEMWYKEEICFYFPEYIKSFHFDEDYGHLVQLTWADSWKVGCGYATYREGSEKKSLYTCNYGPAGNVKKGTHYIEGNPCSKCPKNTVCSRKYPALCKSKTEDGPQKERPPSKEYVLYCDFSKDDANECKNVKVTGSRSFSTRHIYRGNYKTVVLQGGESITIGLGKAASKEGICPFIYSRFGPNNAKDTAGSVVEILFSSEMIQPLTPKILLPQTSFFSTAGVYMKSDIEFQTTVTLKANAGAAPQYFNIKAWGIRRGRCPTGL